MMFGPIAEHPNSVHAVHFIIKATSGHLVFTFFWVIFHHILKPVKCKICIPVITWNLNKGLYEGFCYTGSLGVRHLFCMLCLTYREYVQNKS